MVNAKANRIVEGITRITGNSTKATFLLLVLEAIFGGFYVTVSRSITPIFLVASGFILRELLILNVFAGLLSLGVALVLYYYGKPRSVKARLVLALLIERIFWFLIPWFIDNRLLVTLIYASAIASTIPSNVFMYTVFFACFEEQRYRRLVAYRTMAGAIASIVAQIVVVSTLAVGEGLWKYIVLYIIAFSIGLVSPMLIVLAPIHRVVFEATRRSEEEAEIEASNIYLLLVFLLASTNLLGVSWIPRLMKDLGAPDYLAASIGFVQTLTNIFASVFWSHRNVPSYRYAILLLSSTPLMVYFTTIPYMHLGIAVIYSFSLIGANFYASIGFANLVKKLGVARASVLLSSANALAMVIGGIVGYLLVFSPVLVFMAASIFSLMGLVIALIALPELAIVPPNYTRLYARMLYTSSITSYNFIMFAVSETAKTVLRFTGLVVGVIILYIIYRTLYYIVVLTGG
ncbi:MAG TPA: hypothetical protein ENG44_03800 [Desulfurococcaceae archaeon]|nr:hypothetical protein [Desulfurococcaceae archaeon]